MNKVNLKNVTVTQIVTDQDILLLDLSGFDVIYNRDNFSLIQDYNLKGINALKVAKLLNMDLPSWCPDAGAVFSTIHNTNRHLNRLKGVVEKLSRDIAAAEDIISKAAEFEKNSQSM